MVPLVCFGLVAWGFVLLFQGSLGRDPDAGYSAAQKMFADDYQGIHHGQERHPRRLVAGGIGLIVLGIGLVLGWGTIWG